MIFSKISAKNIEAKTPSSHFIYKYPYIDLIGPGKALTSCSLTCYESDCNMINISLALYYGNVSIAIYIRGRLLFLPTYLSASFRNPIRKEGLDDV